MKDFQGNWPDSKRTNIDPNSLDVDDGRYAGGSHGGPTGTCYASKICGRVSGVAKRATIIPMNRTLFGPQWLIAMLHKILGEIQARRQKKSPQCLPGKTVVVLLFDYDLTDPQYELNSKQQDLAQSMIGIAIKAIMNLGVIVITLAGEEKMVKTLNQPASNYVPQAVASQEIPLLRVGTVDNTGRISSVLKNGDVYYPKKGDVYMVGQNFVCAGDNMFPIPPVNKYLTNQNGTAGGEFFLC